MTNGLRLLVYNRGAVSLMWCSECGPLGVSESRQDGMMTARAHIEEHGFHCEGEVQE